MLRRLALPAILLVLILAAALRIWGVGWGLPGDTHYFSYHPDETSILFAALNVDLFGGAVDPGFYNYGSLFIYLVNIATVAGTLFGAINLPEDPFTRIGEFAKLYEAGRIIAVALGILTVWAVYALGRRAYGHRAGMLAALFMAILPIHVMHSKFMAVDVPATFFVVLSLVFALRITDGHRLRDYVFAGLLAGLAAGTKYNCGLVLLSPVAAHLATAKGSPLRRTFDPKLLGAIAGAAVGFLIATPGAVLHTHTFLRDFTYELAHARSGHGLLFTDTGSGFVYHITHSLWPGMGLPLLALAGLGLLYALKKHTPADKALLVFLVAYYAVIGLAQVRFARYTMPVLPVLALLAARVSVDLMNRLFSGRAFSRTVGCVTALLLVGMIGYTSAYSVAINRMFTRPDTRDVAADWILLHVPVESSIGLPTVPWFYTPPLDPYFGLVDPDERYGRAIDFPEYDIVVSRNSEWNADFLKGEEPSYVVLSEFEYEDRLRVHDASVKEYFEVLDQDYSPAREFKSGLSLFGRRIPWLPELPHDMSYVSPTIKVYERKAG